MSKILEKIKRRMAAGGRPALGRKKAFANQE